MKYDPHLRIQAMLLSPLIQIDIAIFTARKRSLRRVSFYTCLSVHRGWEWYPSMPCRSPDPHPGRKLRGLACGGLQAHTQGEVEGSSLGGLQAHMGGGVPGTQPGGLPACTEVDLPAVSYCCRWYASYWNAFL